MTEELRELGVDLGHRRINGWPLSSLATKRLPVAVLRQL